MEPANRRLKGGRRWSEDRVPWPFGRSIPVATQTDLPWPAGPRIRYGSAARSHRSPRSKRRRWYLRDVNGSGPPAPLVTVAILVYNGERYLAETIRCVQAQTESRIEILVMDDGSTDGSRAIAEEAGQEDDRVRVVSIPNSGVAHARNVALKEATAPLVALLDHDDLFLPEKLEAQLEAFQEHPDVAVVGTFGWRMGSRGAVLSAFDVGPVTREEFHRKRDKNSLIYLLASSVMLRRDVVERIGGFRKEPGGSEDVDLWTRIADEHVILTLPRRLVKYRVHATSQSTGGLFAQMENTERLVLNTRRRRSGEPELSLSEFRSLRASEPTWRKLRRWFHWRSRYAYRVAGGHLADRRPIGALWLVLSFVLAPTVPLGRLRQQFVPLLRSERGGGTPRPTERARSESASPRTDG